MIFGDSVYYLFKGYIGDSLLTINAPLILKMRPIM